MLGLLTGPSRGGMKGGQPYLLTVGMTCVGAQQVHEEVAMHEAENMERLQKLTARVKEEAVQASRRSLPAIPAGLAAAVEELSDWLHNVTMLDLLLRTEGGGQLTADLQRTFCVGDLLARFCSADGVAQNSAAVDGFLLGLGAITAAVPGLPVDCVALMALGAHIASAVTVAPKRHDTAEGVDSLTGLQQLRQTYLWLVGTRLTEAQFADLCGQGFSSAVVDPLLHLTLGELRAAAQLEEGQHSGQAEPALDDITSLDQAGRHGSSLQPQDHTRAGQAALRVTALFLLAVEEAGHCGMRLPSLVGWGAGLVKVFSQYTDRGSQLASLQLGPAVDGPATVLYLQHGVLTPLQRPLLSRAQKSALKEHLNERMEWGRAAAALAKVLHHAADAAAGGSNSRAQQRGLARERARDAWEGLRTSMLLMREVYLGHYELGHPRNANCVGQPGGFAMVPGAVEPLLELAELLLRLVAKLPALAGLGVSPDPAQDQHEPAKLLLSTGAFITSDLTAASSFGMAGGPQPGQPGQFGKHHPSMSSGIRGGSSSSDSSKSGSSNMGMVPGSLLWKVVSLAGTALKFARCLPAIAPGLGYEDSSSLAGQYQRLVKNVTALCCSVLAVNPHLVENPGPHRSLTHHLQSTGFLPFLCLPALAQAMACPDLQASHLLAANQKPTTDIQELLVQLRKLHLIDDAVRGGGLGPLLKHYMQKLLGAGNSTGAATILLQLCEVLEEEHAEALAVTLAKDGLLHAAADYCLGLVRCQKVKEMDGMLTSTALLLRAVCAVLDENASTGLLTTFSALLKDVPILQACTRKTGSHGTKDVYITVPPGPWVARYLTDRAWIQVCSNLLPELSTACEAVASGSHKEQQQDGMFRDVAVSAWTCCNPGCTNMAGQQEASLGLSKCAGCGEARYCSKQCQRQDWRRHKPICHAIKQLK